MTARQNIEFGIASWPAARAARTRNASRVAARPRRARRTAGRGRCPAASSSASRWRARSPSEPSLLLLDEPFSALEAPLRSMLRREVAALRRRLDLTALFVTHDLGEAYALADRIVVYDDGAVLQSGSRDDVFRRPASRRVAELVEARNIVPGTIDAYAEGVAVVRTPWFTARVRDPEAPIRGDVFVVHPARTHHRAP